MTKDNNNEVTIRVYHVIDGDGVHRFRTANDRFIEYVGGRNAAEARLRAQFPSVELLGTCSVGAGSDAGQGVVDDRASVEIVEKIKAIALKYPGTDPLPQPWSETEYQRDLASASGEPHDFKLLEAEIVKDFLQILTAAQNIHVVVGIIHHRGKLLAGPVLQDALKSGFALHAGGAPAEKAYVSILPDPATGSQHWKAISPEKLAIPLSPPPGDQPIAYLVVCSGGQHALALAGRRDGGRVCWSGNGDLIDMITHLLADIGVLRKTHI